jgi:hypothetical protein
LTALYAVVPFLSFRLNKSKVGRETKMLSSPKSPVR